MPQCSKCNNCQWKFWLPFVSLQFFIEKEKHDKADNTSLCSRPCSKALQNKPEMGCRKMFTSIATLLSACFGYVSLAFHENWQEEENGEIKHLAPQRKASQHYCLMSRIVVRVSVGTRRFSGSAGLFQRVPSSWSLAVPSLCCMPLCNNRGSCVL